jgi:hypothetical protein
MNKKTLKALVMALTLSSSVYGYHVMRDGQGLDNNHQDNIDTTLETKSTEEDLFDDTANLIASFVETQYKIRNYLKHDLGSTFLRHLFVKDETKKRILEDLPNKGVYASRDVHRKTHGCFEGEIEVSDSIIYDLNNQIDKFIKERENEKIEGKNVLPEMIAATHDLGVFQPGKKYKSIVRYSNGHPGNRHDKLPDARGMAVKFLETDVDLDQADTKEINSSTALDILTINFPTFFVNSASRYMTINKYFLKSAEDDQTKLWGKLVEGVAILATGMTGLEKKLALKTNGSIIENPLYEQYFSMVPSRLGRPGQARAIKYVWEPISCQDDSVIKNHKYQPSYTKLRNYAYPTKNLPILGPNVPQFRNKQDQWKYGHYYLRERAHSTLRAGDHCYQLYAQLYRDQETTNIEDSLDIWFGSKEEKIWWINEVADELNEADYMRKILYKKITPRIKIAKLTMKQLKQGQLAKNSKLCEDLSFNPWNGNVHYHKPLGQISRLKQKVYNTVRRTRHRLNAIDSSSQERLD